MDSRKMKRDYSQAMLKGQIASSRVKTAAILGLRNCCEDLIIVSGSGQENVRQENGKSSIFLSYIFLSAGLHGRYDDQSLL